MKQQSTSGGNEAQGSMRLDKFLKVSRIIKRRSVANDACDTGHVMLNGREAKPGADVHVGDILSVRFGERLTQYEVVTLSEHVLKQDAAGMYRMIPG
jgi:ribosomal 50S subunit-recycling heat shock protein